MIDDESLSDRPAAEQAHREFPPGQIRPGKLTREQQAYVVRRLAAYDRPADIARDVQGKFGLEMSRQAIEQYDPMRGGRCAKEWVDLFHSARDEYLGGEAALSSKGRQVERILLRTIEILADRILKG